MPLTGNTYGSRVARVGVPVLLALDFGNDDGPTIYEARIIAILDNGTPVIGRIGAEPMTSTSYTFQPTTDAEDVDALSGGEWTWPIDRGEILGRKTVAAAADVTASTGSWTTMHSTTYTSVGGTALSIQWQIVADVTVGGKTRLVVSGGVYGAGTQIGPEMSFDALPSAPVNSFTPASLPAVDPAVEYTISIQAQAVGVGASVAMNAASSPLANGARIAPVEYH